MSFKNLRLQNKDLDFIYDSLQDEGMVRISGLGVFSIKKINPRKFFSPFAGKEVITKKLNKLCFRPFTKTKEKVQSF